MAKEEECLATYHTTIHGEEIDVELVKRQDTADQAAVPSDASKAQIVRALETVYANGEAVDQSMSELAETLNALQRQLAPCELEGDIMSGIAESLILEAIQAGAPDKLNEAFLESVTKITPLLDSSRST